MIKERERQTGVLYRSFRDDFKDFESMRGAEILQKVIDADKHELSIVGRIQEIRPDLIKDELRKEKEMEVEPELVSKIMNKKTGCKTRIWAIYPTRVRETKEYFPKFQREKEEMSSEIEEGIEKYKAELEQAEKEGDSEKVERLAHKIEVEEDKLEGLRLGSQLQARGFGKAALEAGDLIPAIDCLQFSGDLKKPEVVSKVKKRMEDLKKSKESEDKELLIEASKKLIEISKGEKKE